MEKGLVIKADDKKMTIRLSATEACKSCGGCHIKDGAAILPDVDNTVNAREGDTVFLENKASSTVIAAAIVYIMPVFFLIAGYFLGMTLVKFLHIAEGFAVLIAMLVFFSSFLLVQVLDKQIGKSSNFKPTIVRKM